MQTVYYIGLDVHKDTIQMAVLSASQQEPVAEKTLSSDYAKLGKAILPYKEDGNIVQVAYEAGCLGYALYRFLTKLKVDCRVIPPNKVFRGGNDRQIKTDKRDAILIAKMLKRNEGESAETPFPTTFRRRKMNRPGTCFVAVAI
jgi:transposase